VTVLPGATIIASGYLHRPDPAALVVGPTGLAYDAHHDVLYVASTGDNAVFAINNAATANHDGGMGTLVYQDNAHLRGPLGLALAPNGHLITANGDAVNADTTQPSELVEFTVNGQFVAQFSIDSVQGSAFGIAFGMDSHQHVQFAAVDDDTNTATVWTLHTNNP
jgi:DNA-binding beta-propeller fold protein YncE